MKQQVFDKPRALEKLRLSIETAGGPGKFADKHKLSRQFLYDVLSGRREFTPRLARAIGLAVTVEWVRHETFRPL